MLSLKLKSMKSGYFTCKLIRGFFPTFYSQGIASVKCTLVVPAAATVNPSVAFPVCHNKSSLLVFNVGTLLLKLRALLWSCRWFCTVALAQPPKTTSVCVETSKLIKNGFGQVGLHLNKCVLLDLKKSLDGIKTILHCANDSFCTGHSKSSSNTCFVFVLLTYYIMS